MNKLMLKKEYKVPENLEFHILLELMEYEKGRKTGLPLIEAISAKNSLNTQTVVNLLYKYLEDRKTRTLENLPDEFYMEFRNARGR